MNINNMVLALRCAEAFVKTLEARRLGTDAGVIEIDKIKFNTALAPLALRFDDLRDVEGLAAIIMEEVAFAGGELTECLIFVLAHRLYHEAFDTTVGVKRQRTT